MRRTLIGLVAGVALIAAACGGNDSDADSNADDTEAADTSETTANPDGGDDAAAPAGEPGEFADTQFCEDFRTLDPGGDEAAVIEALRSLDPPEELQADMTTLADTLEELAALDLDNNPEALNENQDKVTTLQRAAVNVSTACDDGSAPGGGPPPDDGSGNAPENG